MRLMNAYIWFMHNELEGRSEGCMQENSKKRMEVNRKGTHDSHDHRKLHDKNVKKK